VLKKILFTIIGFLIFLLLAETAARIFEKSLISAQGKTPFKRGWQTEFFGRILEWHEPDPHLLWRFKAGLQNPLLTTNSQHFLGAEFETEKADNSFRIMVIGDSSPVGLGLKGRNQCFDSKLRQLLQKDYLGVKNIEVINTSVSGYTSEQLRVFMEREAFKYDPDLIVVYCGNNDASISGAFSDRQILEAQKIPAIRKLFGKLALYRIAVALLKGSEDISNPEQGIMQVRVDPRRFRENLAAIYGMCRSRDCPLIILKPPVPMLWPPGVQFRIFSHFSDSLGEPIIPPELEQLLTQGAVFNYCIDSTLFSEMLENRDEFAKAVFEVVDKMNRQAMNEEKKSLADSISQTDLADWEIPPENNSRFAFDCWKGGDYNKAIVYYLMAAEGRRQNGTYSKGPGGLSLEAPYQFNIGLNYLYADSISIIDLYRDTTTEAFAYLDSALQNDYLSLRIKRSYWEVIDEMAGNAGISVIDLPLVFKQNGGERLFIDHCHPTEEGHSIIAEEIYRAIKSGYQP